MWSKANPPTSGSSRGAEAVEKAKKASTCLLEIKYPDRVKSEVSVKLTAPLEVKYHNFTSPGAIEKMKDLTSSEV